MWLCLLQVSFSESGSLGNSSGSDVTSLSSQLPDTPNSMVPSPVETWNCPPPPPYQTRRSSLLQRTIAAWSRSPPYPSPCTWPAHHITQNYKGEFQKNIFFISWHGGDGTRIAPPPPLTPDFIYFCGAFIDKKLRRTIAWRDTERDVQKTSWWM